MRKVGATSLTAATAEDWEFAVAQGRRRYIADAGVAA